MCVGGRTGNVAEDINKARGDVWVNSYLTTEGKQLIIYLSLSHVNPIPKLLLTKKGNEV